MSTIFQVKQFFSRIKIKHILVPCPLTLAYEYVLVSSTKPMELYKLSKKKIDNDVVTNAIKLPLFSKHKNKNKNCAH